MNKYRILELENKAGGKEWCCQYRKSIFFGFFSYWQNFYYFDSSQSLKDYHNILSYANICDARNCIKYHKMFCNDKDKTTIIPIND